MEAIGGVTVHAFVECAKLSHRMPAPILSEMQLRPWLRIGAIADLRGKIRGPLPQRLVFVLGSAEEMRRPCLHYLDELDRLFLGDTRILEDGLARWSDGRRLEATI